MVTVEIKWNGREETMDERLGVVKGIINDLPCFDVSPFASYYLSYVCRDAVIHVEEDYGRVNVEIIGVNNAVFEYAIIMAGRIKKYIEEKVNEEKWDKNDPETDVFADLHEAEVKCGCEA